MARYVLDSPEGFVHIDIDRSGSGWRWVSLDELGEARGTPVVGFPTVQAALADARDAFDAEAAAEEERRR